MTWNSRYRISSYIRSALWTIPLVAALIAQFIGWILEWLDARFEVTGLGFGVDGAKAMFNAIITVTLSFIVFTFGSLLVAIQVAGGQYTPRIIATTLLRDNVIRYSVGLFVLTFLQAIKGIDRIEGTVHQLVALVTGILGLASIATFLYLIDHAARMLRPVSLVRRVGEDGLAVIDSVYLDRFGEELEDERRRNPGAPGRTVIHQGSSAIVIAVNVADLVAEARASQGVIQFVPQVGDFVGVGEPLFHLHGSATNIADAALRSKVAFGSERTMEQDPLFALRILVDIAIKALSAAINDPTTAVLAIDQLHRLLRRAGTRALHSNHVLDRGGTLRMIFRTPDWESFVRLACCEIRFCGAGNMQVARRLRAMFLNLRETLPPERHRALAEELTLLDRMLEKLYLFPEDLKQARIPDPQGLGGAI
jgi:uncharacterized membrane protein